MRGEEKEHITVWLTLGQRTLRYEAYVMPAPQENVAQVYELALRRNEKLVGAHFAIGVEDALFLRGELPLVARVRRRARPRHRLAVRVRRAELPGLIRLGFASHFAALRPFPLRAAPTRISVGAGTDGTLRGMS